MSTGAVMHALAEGKTPGPAENCHVAYIEIGVAAIGCEIEGILRADEVGISAGGVDAVSVGVGSLKVQGTGDVVDVSDLKRVVDGVGAIAIEGAVREVGIGAAGGDG